MKHMLPNKLNTITSIQFEYNIFFVKSTNIFVKKSTIKCMLEIHYDHWIFMMSFCMDNCRDTITHCKNKIKRILSFIVKIKISERLPYS